MRTTLELSCRLSIKSIGRYTFEEPLGLPRVEIDFDCRNAASETGRLTISSRAGA